MRCTHSDGQQVAQGRIERTIRARFSLDETFDVGEDTGTPVIEVESSVTSIVVNPPK